uniref:Putative GAF sensor protein n=2 Tax=Gloeothece TaxID=28070 RepID=E0U8V6_GLOV7|nr:putative GAF sensor protein [Gloeothece verrucosa PCC 7822]
MIWVEETYTLPPEEARQTIRNYFRQYRQKIYKTHVSHWHLAQDEQIYFVIRRLSSSPSREQFIQRLTESLERDILVQQTVNELRKRLEVDRVVLYYFYSCWKGQVTFEALSQPEFSIMGMAGPDECFNQEYADWYQAGRFRAISDIENESIAVCHRDFLRSLKVRANLVVPLLNRQGLWGLLIAHHCQGVKFWTLAEIEAMQDAAVRLEQSLAILKS